MPHTSILWQIDPCQVISSFAFNYTGKEEPIAIWNDRKEITNFFKGLLRSKAIASHCYRPPVCMQISESDIALLTNEIYNQSLHRDFCCLDFNTEIYKDQDLEKLQSALYTLNEGYLVFYMEL